MRTHAGLAPCTQDYRSLNRGSPAERPVDRRSRDLTTPLQPRQPQVTDGAPRLDKLPKALRAAQTATMAHAGAVSAASTAELVAQAAGIGDHPPPAPLSPTAEQGTSPLPTTPQ